MLAVMSNGRSAGSYRSVAWASSAAVRIMVVASNMEKKNIGSILPYCAFLFNGWRYYTKVYLFPLAGKCYNCAVRLPKKPNEEFK